MILLLIGLSLSSCQTTNCDSFESELATTKKELNQRDSVLQLIGATFMAIDSNTRELRQIEMSLLDEVTKNGKKNKDLITQQVDRIKQITAENQQLVDKLEADLDMDGKFGEVFTGLISSIQDRMGMNNVRLSKLNNDLGSLGSDFRSLFDEYVNAEAARWMLEEDMQKMQGNMKNMQGNMSEMEAQMQNMKNQLSTCYVVVGTKRELVDNQVLEKGGILKGDQINDNTNLMTFKPYDLNELDRVKMSPGKYKIVTRHPTDSYTVKTEGGVNVLYIESPSNFWSLSKYLIVQI